MYSRCMTALSFATAEDTPLIRIDYSKDEIWRHVLSEAQRVSDKGFGGYDFVARVEVFDDPKPMEASALQLAKQAAEENENIALCVFADAITMTHPERPLLCVDLIDFTEVRVIPSQLQSIENGLSVGVLEMDQYAEAADSDGIFRGFKE